jgi:hypothetical protein
VRPAPGDVPYPGRGIGRLDGVDADLGAHLGGEVQRRARHVHRDHPGTERPSHHHRGQADAAAAVDGHPVARPDPRMGGHGAMCRRDAAAEASGGDEAEPIGQPHEVHVRVVHPDVLGEGTGVGEPGLGLPLAHLVLAVGAGLARSARAHERCGDPIAGSPVPHERTDGLDDAGELVAGHVRQSHVRVMTHPPVPVAAAQSTRLDPDDGPRGAGGGIGYRPHLGPTAELGVHDRAHGASPGPHVGTRRAPGPRAVAAPHRAAPATFGQCDGGEHEGARRGVAVPGLPGEDCRLVRAQSRAPPRRPDREPRVVRGPPVARWRTGWGPHPGTGHDSTRSRTVSGNDRSRDTASGG